MTGDICEGISQILSGILGQSREHMAVQERLRIECDAAAEELDDAIKNHATMLRQLHDDRTRLLTLLNSLLKLDGKQLPRIARDMIQDTLDIRGNINEPS